MTAPLLYVCVRPQQGAAAAEYESFRSAMRLDESQLAQLDLVRAPLPDDAFERYSGFVIGGSPFNVTDPETSKTVVQRSLEAALASIVEVCAASPDGPAALFTCYGIGIVTRTLGGQVSRAYPENAGPTAVELEPAASSDPLFGGLATQFTVLTGHKEGTAEPPPGAVLLARGSECPVQSYRVGQRLYATQFHPEATVGAFIERMGIYRDDGYFDASDFDAIAGRVRAASVTEPTRLLRAFARQFGPTVA